MLATQRGLRAFLEREELIWLNKCSLCPTFALQGSESMSRSFRLMTVVLLLAAFPATLWAENEGQEDLDKATELQLRVQSIQDAEEVVKLAESALQKGLDEENTKFAKQLITSSLWQRATRLSAEILESQPPNPRWRQIRRDVLATLEKLLKHDDKLPDAHILIAKLQLLPGGDPERARTAVSRAVELYQDNKSKLAETLVLRAQLREKPEDQLADFNAAVEADPANAMAWQARAAFHITRGDFDKAIADFEQILEKDPENIQIRQALTEALTNLEKFDLALKHANKTIELQPQASINYTLRARVHERMNDLKAAIADLDQAVKIEPQDRIALYTRARLHLMQDDYPAAREDLNKFLQLEPGSAQGVLLRSMIAAGEKRFHEAIADLQLLLRANPKSVEIRMQLASYLVADQRPRKALEMYNAILEEDKDNWMALRARGDALLSIGKHKEAIADYEAGLKLQPEDQGLLNNLAWVLATSTFDELRNAKRSIELGTKACEATKFEMPHILSTLAAGYAEAGDFENAIKWSTKAVELGREKLKEQLEQLEKELESYKDKKPWRELQQIEDKPSPPRNVIDT
jgi:tetratricopeptide (TPR) repeat protein